MEQQFITSSFLDYFSNVEDPRLDRMRLYSIEEILLVTLAGTLAGCDGWSEIEEYGKTKLDFLRTLLPFSNGCPSDDTLRRFFRVIEPKQFQECFLKWIESLRSHLNGKLISIDGKTVCGSSDPKTEKSAIHMVTAFASEARLVLAQEKVFEKSNEITAIPLLLRLLDIQDSTITIDAMGCQRGIAEQIREQGGNYILGLKGNQGNLHNEVKELFANNEKLPPNKRINTASTIVDKGHGRIETRTCQVITNLRCVEEKDKWRDLSSIIKIESQRIIGEKIEISERYYITSHSDKSAAWLNKAIRSHWAIENSLHWVLDVVFNEDDSRIRKGNAPHNMAIIKHAALNMIQAVKTKRQSIKRVRKMSGWDDGILKKVLLGDQL